MRYADSKDVLEKSHNLASESEATVLPTPDSVFIKISRTPRSAVSPDKGAPTILIVLHCEIVVTSQSLRDTVKVFEKFSPLSYYLRVSCRNTTTWICRRVGSSCGAVSDQVSRIYFIARQAFRRKKSLACCADYQGYKVDLIGCKDRLS